MRTRLTSISFTILAVLILLWPSTADAQRRGSRGRTHAVVIVGGTFGSPGFWLYDQWGPWGPYGPYGPYGPWGPWGRPYPRYYNLDEFVSSVKFDVHPKDAEVYVDGALAGQVDDFDGIFQRLRVKPGSREIVVYRDGFKSVREQIYIAPYAEKKLRFDLQPLAPGDPADPRPTPPPPGPAPEPRMPRAEPSRPREPLPPPEPRRDAPVEFGTLSIRVQPADADVLVDGERWTGPASGERLSIQLPVGRHRIEVRKEGLSTYTEEVLIRRGSTLTLNVSLK